MLKEQDTVSLLAQRNKVWRKGGWKGGKRRRKGEGSWRMEEVKKWRRNGGGGEVDGVMRGVVDR